jgi:hypothetical protein
MDRDLGGYRITEGGVFVCEHRAEVTELDTGPIPRLIVFTSHGVLAVRCSDLPPLPKKRREP